MAVAAEPLPPDTPSAPAEGRRGVEPVGQLPPQDWMADPATRAVTGALAAAGWPVRFVGGCVRDAVLRRAVHDLDLATPARPEQVVAALEAAGLRVVPTGLAHGTVTALAGGRAFEITTLRVDADCDGRHARVTFTDDWLADAARRDFTINAMSADLDGRVFDPFDGLADLGAGRVRFVGLADRRIEEDALRLLRFFRFHAHYGRRGVLDSQALVACRRHADRLAGLSGERVAAEMLRLLAAPDPATVLVTMVANAILAPILPEARDVERLRQLSWLESRGLARPDVVPDPLRRLAALLGPDRAAALDVARRLRLSNDDAARLADLAAPPCPVAPDPDPRIVRRRLHALGAARVRDIALLTWAGRRIALRHPEPAETAGWLALLDLGMAPGPAVGRLLARVESWWVDADFRPDAAACRAQARALLAEGGEDAPA